MCQMLINVSDKWGDITYCLSRGPLYNQQLMQKSICLPSQLHVVSALYVSHRQRAVCVNLVECSIIQQTILTKETIFLSNTTSWSREPEDDAKYKCITGDCGSRDTFNTWSLTTTSGNIINITLVIMIIIITKDNVATTDYYRVSRHYSIVIQCSWSLCLLLHGVRKKRNQ